MGERVLHHIAPLGPLIRPAPYTMHAEEGRYIRPDNLIKVPIVFGYVGWENSIGLWSKLVWEGWCHGSYSIVESICKKNDSLWAYEMIYIMRSWHPYQAWLLFFSRSLFVFFPITGHCLSYRSVLNYASHKISRFGWQAPNTLCVAKLYYHIKNTYTYALYIAYNKCTGTQYIIVIHSTFYILTPSYTYIEDPWRAFL